MTGSLRVLVDATSAYTGGGATFIESQLEALDATGDVSLTIHATAHVATRISDRCPQATVVRHANRSAPARLAWEQIYLGSSSGQYDVAYMPANFALMATRVPQVLTVQNAWYFGRASREFRRHCPPALRARVSVEALLARASVRKAARVVAVSHSMRDAIASEGTAQHKLHAVPSAPPPTFAQVNPGDVRRGGAPEFVLCVSNDHPHKDWDGLIAAFLADGSLPDLRIVGRCAPARREAIERRLGEVAAGRRVQIVGEVNDRAALRRLYQEAGCVIAHSHLESFGFTPCEGFSAGCPVAASDIPAHREVCEEAASYYAPTDPAKLGRAVKDAIQRGRMPMPRIMERTWSENAREMVCLFSEVSGSADGTRS